MIKNEIEIWKSLSGVPGIEVSTFGRVRSLDKVVSSEKYTRFQKGRILKQWDNGRGYLYVSLQINGKKVNRRVHRLVAQTFLPNPNCLPMVNHKDCNITNNNVENLEFCTASYNSKYREEFGNALSKPVFAINLSTLEVSHFHSQIEASRVLGTSVGNINNVIKGKYRYIHRYWLVNDDDNAVNATKYKLHDIGETRLKAKQVTDKASIDFISRCRIVDIN